MSSFIVPAGEGGIQVTDQMKKDAQAAAGSVDGAPRLHTVYLTQATSEIVKAKKAQDGDWLIGRDEDEVNVGQNPMFIVLTAQTRFKHTVEAVNERGRKYRKTVWDAAKGALTPKQNDEVMSKVAKRYTMMTMIHVNEDGVDPHKKGPLSYDADGMSTLAGMKLADKIAMQLVQGVAPYGVAWKFGSAVEPTPDGDGSWNVLSHEGPFRLNLDEEMTKKLRGSWQFAVAKRDMDAGTVITGGSEPDYGAMADEAIEAERVKDADYDSSDTTTIALGVRDNAPPDEYGDDAYATELPANYPDVPEAAKKLNMDYSTAVACGRVDGVVVKESIADLTFNEAKVAVELALPHVPKNPVAAAVAELVDRWARHKGWDPEALGLPAF